ncbi:hypothetical protein AB0M02_25115 [Actinoplanes sp. NPDC051861]|uniref:hypothetical protein n=1 Tax=Actinoplanes sp. NPDC051861 TaxID=3155170 RepID=UPI0034172610
MTLIASLLGAVVGGAATALTSYQATSTSRHLQEADFEQRRLDEQRVKRTEAYQAYLKSADEEIAEIQTILSCMGPCAFHLQTEQQIAALAPECGRRSSARLISLGRNLSRSTDALFIYGSPAAQVFSRTLNANLGTIEAWAIGLTPADIALERFGDIGTMFAQVGKAIEKARDNFRKTMCEELNPVEKAGC